MTGKPFIRYDSHTKTYVKFFTPFCYSYMVGLPVYRGIAQLGRALGLGPKC